MYSPQELTKLLSELAVFSDARPELEQYPTDPLTATQVLFEMVKRGDIVGKRIGDLGCGTGILGIGALLLGAEHVTFIDIDKKALDILEENFHHILCSTACDFLEQSEIVCEDINHCLNYEFDVVVMNPPFGVQKKNADRVFLAKAMNFSPVIYGFFKEESAIFVIEFTEHYHFFTDIVMTYPFMLHKSMQHHTKPEHVLNVSVLRLHRE